MYHSFVCSTCSGNGYIINIITEKPVYCPCCGGLKTTSTGRHLQFYIGANVLLLQDGLDAPVYAMNERIQLLIHTECQRLNLPEPTLIPCAEEDLIPQHVVLYYTNQFMDEDCLQIIGGTKGLINKTLFNSRKSVDELVSQTESKNRPPIL